jgi:hypothetical protein
MRSPSNGRSRHPGRAAADRRGRRVGAGRGPALPGDGWRCSRRRCLWVACFLIFLLIMFVLAIIPLLGNIAGALLSPVLIGGIMLGRPERDEELTGHLHNRPLLTLGLNSRCAGRDAGRCRDHHRHRRRDVPGR